jgi:hypothetical protein
MISFELFFEKCQAPVEVLTKYKDDPNVFISFTNVIQPRGAKEGLEVEEIDSYGNINKVDKTISKQTSRIGLNPLTSFDTPAGVYTYPLNAYWNNIKNYDIPYVKDLPYVYVIKPKNPDRCARTSTYTNEDLKRDSDELMEMYPQYHLEDIMVGDYSTILDKYPSSNHKHKLYISPEYQNPPLRFFWSLTRALAYLMMEDIAKKQETKTKHITVWTHIMRRFYDGIIDDTGSSTIHSNEPYQAVFWTNAQFNIIDKIDRTCGKKDKYSSRNSNEWMGTSPSSVLHNSKVFDIIKKAYTSGQENKLNESLIKILKSRGIHNVYYKMKKGDPDLFWTDFDGVFDNTSIVYKNLAIMLYLDNRLSDEEVFDDKNLSTLNDSFVRDNTPILASLLKRTSNSIESARGLLDGMLLYHYQDYSKNTEPVYKKLLDIIVKYSDSYDNVYIINSILRDFSNIPISKLIETPRILSKLTIMFNRTPVGKYNEDSDKIANDLLQAVRATKTKNPEVWKRFFQYFLYNYNTGKERVSKNLDIFLDSNTGLEDELKDYINSNMNSSVSDQYKEYMNNVWQKYYGVDLIRPDLSQFDVIKKSRKLQPSAPTNTKYKVGDVVALKYNDGFIYGIVQNIIDGYNEPIYKIMWEDNPNDTSTEYESDLKTDDTRAKFKKGDIVEDEDGLLYKVRYIVPGDKNMEVYNDEEDSIVKVDDMILYDPKTSLHKSAFEIGDRVKIINHPTTAYVGRLGKVVKYDPFSSIKYEVRLDNGTLVYIISGNSLKKAEDSDELTIANFKPGDTIIVNHSSKSKSKYIIKSIDSNNYIYDVYVWEDDSWDLQTPEMNYPISSFDNYIEKNKDIITVDSKYDDTDALQGHGFSTTKYKIGDVVIDNVLDHNNRRTKYVITGIDPPNYIYNVYKSSTKIGWVKTVDDFKYAIKLFDNFKNFKTSNEDTSDVVTKSPKLNNYGPNEEFENKTNKIDVISYNKEKDTYHIKYYHKTLQGNLELDLDDKNINRKIFDEDINKLLEDGIYTYIPPF